MPILQRKDPGGFTLIELMIVVAIIVILAAIAIPNFMTYQAKARQAEAKVGLGGLFTTATTYFAENCTFLVAGQLDYVFAGTPKYSLWYDVSGTPTAVPGGSASVRKISPDDQIVRRKGRLYVINKRKPKHKQRQG